MKFRQLRKLSKMCASTALATVLFLSVGANTLAATNGKNAAVSDGETSVRAAITKVLEMGEGTTTPNAQFTFHFVQKTDAEKTTDADGKEIPIMQDAVAISDVTVDVNGKTGTDNQNGKKVVEVESSDFLANANFQKAGIYVYTVTETPNTYLIADASKEKMTYSQAEYTAFVYVANKADGSGVYVRGIGVVPVKNDEGTAAADTGVTGKVDPTPNPTPDENGGVADGNSKMKFTNTYLKTNGGNGNPLTDENKSLQISKTVAGTMGDQTKYFDFTVTVKKPAVDKTTTAYKGYVVDVVKNEIVTDAANVSEGDVSLVKEDESGRKYIEFTFGEGGAKTQAVKLKHNQEIVFTDAAVGAHFQAVETEAANYTASLVVKANNVTISDSVTATDSGERIVGETRENSARFTNTYVDVTPTGIIMNNLSFVMLIAVAIVAGMVVFVMGNRRKYQA